MDCRRRWAVDDDRSRRWVVDDDRYPRRRAADDDRSRIAFYQTQAKVSFDRIDKNLDRIDKNLRSISRMRMSSATIPRYSSSSSSSTSRERHQFLHKITVVEDYPPLELPLRWRDPPLLQHPPPPDFPAFRTLQRNTAIELVEQSHTKSSPIITEEATTASTPPLQLAPKTAISTSPFGFPLRSCNPKSTPMSARTALPPLLPPPLSFCHPTPNPSLESTEPLPSFSYPSSTAHGKVFRAMLKNDSSVSINQEMSENGDDDKGEDFRWSPDPGGTTQLSLPLQLQYRIQIDSASDSSRDQTSAHMGHEFRDPNRISDASGDPTPPHAYAGSTLIPTTLHSPPCATSSRSPPEQSRPECLSEPPYFSTVTVTAYSNHCSHSDRDRNRDCNPTHAVQRVLAPGIQHDLSWPEPDFALNVSPGSALSYLLPLLSSLDPPLIFEVGINMLSLADIPDGKPKWVSDFIITMLTLDRHEFFSTRESIVRNLRAEPYHIHALVSICHAATCVDLFAKEGVRRGQKPRPRITLVDSSALKNHISSEGISGVEIPGLNFTYTIDPIQCTQAARCNVTNDFDPDSKDDFDPNLKRLAKDVQKLDKVSADVSIFLHLLDKTKQEHKERQVGFYITHERGSLPKNDLMGRGKDKEFVLQWLRKPSNELQETDLYRNISLLSIVVHDGMGNTTLLQQACEDEKAEEFDLKMWDCVSNNFDVKKIIAVQFNDSKAEPPHLDWGKPLHVVILKSAFKVFDPGIWFR